MTAPLSEAAWARAETLFERLERLARAFAPPPDLPADAVEAALEPWRRAAARGDGAALARRLAWDGIDPRIAALALVPADGGAHGPWRSLMERWLHAVSEYGRSPIAAGSAEAPPFPELVAPWVEAAAARALAAIPGLEETFAPAAWADWQGALAQRLAWIGAPAFYDRFARERELRGVTGAYARYVEAERGAGFAALFEELPVLARQLAERSEDWVATTVELRGQIESDRAALAARFSAGAEVGRVARLEAGLSDPHARGRRVLALRFESGLELVYKPRPLALEALFERICGDFAAAGFELAPRAAATLDRGSHGWMARVRPADLGEEESVRAWFRSAGALAALAWLLGGRDLHAENLVAASEGPVLVDAEMLLSPAVEGAADSVVSTGLVADPEAPAGPGSWGYAGFDLPDGGALPEEERAWSALGTDALELAWRRPTARALDNVVRWRGRPQRPEAFREELLEGFQRAADFLAARPALLAGPGGALERAPAAETRLLLRPSARYATTVALGVRPRYLADGVTASLLREALLQPLVGEPERPAVWPLAAAEREALESLDLPVFRIGCGATALELPEGTRVEGLFAASGWAAARARLAALEPSAITRQREIFAAALAPHRLPPAQEEQRLAAAAASIAAALGAAPAFAAAPERTDLRALALYGGLAGRALFAAGAARATGEAVWRELALDLAERLARGIEAVDPAESRGGATDGWGSLVWTGVTLAELLGRPEPLELARRAAARGAAAPDSEGRWGWDLAAGEAGALLGLLALAEADPAGGALAAATVAGERLLAAQIGEGEEAGAWPFPGGGPALAGFAHGASGIARALEALGRATGDGRFGAAADRAVAWERRQLDRARGDWPVRIAGARPGEVERRFLGSWCHGAPGVALARVARLAAGSDAAATADLEVALAYAADAPLPEVDHLCCGTAGRLSALTAAGRTLGDAAPLAAGRRLARRALARAEGSGGWRISGGETPGERADLGFFRGYPGLAWSLIALTGAGVELPLVALLELPSERRRRLRSPS